MEKFGTIIIGAGASGLFAALHLGESGRRDVLVLERNDRAGRKLSATGNGQGNVTNTDLASSHYRSSDMRLVSSVLRRFGREELLRYLRSLGGMFVSDGEGRVYPASRQAASVTDLLRYRLAALGIRLNTGEKVLSAHKSGGCFIVTTDRSEYSCSVLVLACGGKASPHFGTDGNGYELARSFGHTVTPLFPSLVQLKTETAHIRGLKGVRCDCRVQLLNGREVIGESRGDVIFTDYGVSGNAVFRLSPLARRADTVMIDFIPDSDVGELQSALLCKTEKEPGMRAADLFRCIVNSAVGKCVLRRCGVDEVRPVGEVSEKLGELAKSAKGYRLKLCGSLGFDSAQVTQGGVPVTELDECLMSKKTGCLYIVGELADVDGDCGGYNLQWAFSSGWVAAGGILGAKNENR